MLIRLPAKQEERLIILLFPHLGGHPQGTFRTQEDNRFTWSFVNFPFSDPDRIVAPVQGMDAG
jgi:hypothetical protein